MKYILIAIILILVLWGLIGIINFILDLQEKEFIYCPKCKGKLTKNGIYSKCEEKMYLRYRCSRCSTISVWEIGNSKPILLSWEEKKMEGKT